MLAQFVLQVSQLETWGSAHGMPWGFASTLPSSDALRVSRAGTAEDNH